MGALKYLRLSIFYLSCFSNIQQQQTTTKTAPCQSPSWNGRGETKGGGGARFRPRGQGGRAQHPAAFEAGPLRSALCFASTTLYSRLSGAERSGSTPPDPPLLSPAAARGEQSRGRATLLTEMQPLRLKTSSAALLRPHVLAHTSCARTSWPERTRPGSPSAVPAPSAPAGSRVLSSILSGRLPFCPLVSVYLFVVWASGWSPSLTREVGFHSCTFTLKADKGHNPGDLCFSQGNPGYLTKLTSTPTSKL